MSLRKLLTNILHEKEAICNNNNINQYLTIRISKKNLLKSKSFKKKKNNSLVYMFADSRALMLRSILFVESKFKAIYKK